jgi:hypothetical protein
MKVVLHLLTLEPGRNGYIFYHSNGSLSNKYDHGEGRLLYHKRDNRDIFFDFSSENWKVDYQEQTGGYIVYTDIFEILPCPYQNGKDLSKNTLDILR